MQTQAGFHSSFATIPGVDKERAGSAIVYPSLKCASCVHRSKVASVWKKSKRAAASVNGNFAYTSRYETETSHVNSSVFS